MKKKIVFLSVVGLSLTLSVGVVLAQPNSNSDNNPFNQVWQAVENLEQIVEGLGGQVDSFFDVFVTVEDLGEQIDSFFDIFVPREEYDADKNELEARVVQLEEQLTELGTMCADCATCCQPPCRPESEVCDGIDNNWDGQIDEGNPGSGQECSTGQAGVCESGTTQCENGELTCVQIHEASVEICDGLDNDCDGQIDEGLGVAEGCGPCVDLDDPSTYGNKIEFENGTYYLLNDVLLCEDVYNLDGGGIQIVTPNLNHILNCNGATLIGNGPVQGTAAAVRVGCWMPAPYLPCTSNVTVKNCNIQDFNVGVKVNMAHQTTVLNNSISNTNYGIAVKGAENCTVEGNDVSSSIFEGIVLDFGLGSRKSKYNDVVNNVITNTGNYGLNMRSAVENTLTGNTITDSGVYGIKLYESEDNTIFNNYFENPNNAYSYSPSGFGNYWNIAKTAGTNIIGGLFLGGNYWSDYLGEDLDSDGLGDTLLPYTSDSEITGGGDSAPLVD